MGPRAGPEGGKSRPHRDSIPDRPARSSFAIPTELPGPRTLFCNTQNFCINDSDKHLKYTDCVVVFPLQKWLRERTKVFRYT